MALPDRGETAVRNLIVIRHSGDAERLTYCSQKIQRSAVDFCVIQEKYHENIPADDVRGNFITLSSDFLQRHRLRKLQKKTGWVCGDYIFYAAKHYFPGYDYYWVIDDDLLLNLDVDAFVAKANRLKLDLLANAFGKSSASWYWRPRLQERFPDAVHAMFFGIVRLSAAAIDFLLPQRASCAQVEDAQYPNDESFVASYLANHGYACANMRTKFSELQPFFSLNNPVLYEEAALPTLANKIAHPLCNIPRAKEKLAASTMDANVKIDTLFRWYVHFGQFFVENNFQPDVLQIFAKKSGGMFFKNIPWLYRQFAHPRLVRAWFYAPRLLVLEFSDGDCQFALDVHWDGRVNFIARSDAAKQLLQHALHQDGRLMQQGDFIGRLAAFSKYWDESQGQPQLLHKISWLADYVLSLRAPAVGTENPPTA